MSAALFFLAGGHLPLAGVSLAIRLLQKRGWVNFKVFFGAFLIPGIFRVLARPCCGREIKRSPGL